MTIKFFFICTYFRHMHIIYKCMCIAYYKWCRYFLACTSFLILASPEELTDLLSPCSYLQKTCKHFPYLCSRPRALTSHTLYLLVQICFLLGQGERGKELIKSHLKSLKKRLHEPGEGRLRAQVALPHWRVILKYQHCCLIHSTAPLG